MITRTAIFEGRIKDGQEEQFFKEVRERLVPLWKQFPKASNVRLLRVEASDVDAAPIVMIQQIDYPSMEDMQAAVASPVRERARAETMDVLRLFEGRFYHVISRGNFVENGGEAVD